MIPIGPLLIHCGDAPWLSFGQPGHFVSSLSPARAPMRGHRWVQAKGLGQNAWDKMHDGGIFSPFYPGTRAYKVGSTA